ncbi:MAG: hypothetical protein WDM80_00790 [Limisphaerales bacterium]
MNIGDTVSFGVTATSINQLNYQWLKDGIGLPNATNAILALTDVQPPFVGNYSAVITSFGGSVTSSVPH